LQGRRQREKEEGKGRGREGIREREGGRKSWREVGRELEGRDSSQKGGRVEGNKVHVWLHVHTHEVRHRLSQDRKHS